jgi:hypothetical protein
MLGPDKNPKKKFWVRKDSAMATKRPVTRSAQPFLNAFPTLGPLGEFPGTWTGRGFNLIARPDFQDKKPFFLELNGTLETLEFTEIGGDIPNRGSKQNDINLRGVRYLQQVADCETLGALHIEPGLWIHIPATAQPNVPNPTVVRHATIPHGDSLLAQSTFLGNVNGGPKIEPVFSAPFKDTTIPVLNGIAKDPVKDAQYLDPYLKPRDFEKCCLPPGLDMRDAVKDPTRVLAAAIQNQDIEKTVIIQISTAAVAGSTGILNIPFVVQNANAAQMDAIFWIETVHPKGEDPFLQLQYVQRVILDFIGIHWPHITVATLVKQ